MTQLDSTIQPDIRRTLLFLRRDRHVLLALKKRGFGVGKWNGVGGKIEPGETIEQAMIRECQEEIGVTPRTWRQVAELDFAQNADLSAPWHMYGYVYVSEGWEGEPIETEEMRPQWFAIDAIAYDTLWSDDEFWLPQVLRGQKVIGTFKFDAADGLLSHDVRIVKELPHERQTV